MKEKANTTARKPKGKEFERLDSFARRLMRVPKAEIDEVAAKEKGRSKPSDNSKDCN